VVKKVDREGRKGLRGTSVQCIFIKMRVKVGGKGGSQSGERIRCFPASTLDTGRPIPYGLE